MANTLTNLIPTLFEAMDVVSREMVGFIPAVTRDSSAERAAKDQPINIPIVPVNTASDVTPGVTAPNDGDAVIGNTIMTISKSRYVPVRWNGEEQKATKQTGLYANVNRDRFAQAMRTLVNEVETDLSNLYYNASRAYGTPGTAPFGTAGDFSDFSQTSRILDTNGAPVSDRQLVLGSSAIANLRGKQNILFKANEAGTTDLLRLGILGMVEGYQIHNSNPITSKTVGTANTATVVGVDTAAIGAVSVSVTAGTGTIITGDVIYFGATAAGAEKYIVKSGCSVISGGTITLQEPGLLTAQPAATGITVCAAAVRNAAFSKSAIALVTRAPAMPDGGDMADDVIEITDPYSGLAFQVARYTQYRQVRYEVGLAWGVKAIAPRHFAALLG